MDSLCVSRKKPIQLSGSFYSSLLLRTPQHAHRPIVRFYRLVQHIYGLNRTHTHARCANSHSATMPTPNDRRLPNGPQIYNSLNEFICLDNIFCVDFFFFFGSVSLLILSSDFILRNGILFSTRVIYVAAILNFKCDPVAGGCATINSVFGLSSDWVKHHR